MPNNLFNEFPPVSSKQWKQQIQFELKGADYNEVVWESPEGIKVRPFYHSDEEITPLKVPSHNSYNICQDIFVFDLEKSIYRAKDSINRGAESIRLIIADSETDIVRILQSLPLDTITLYIEIKFLSAPFIQKIQSELKNKPFKVFILVDPIHQLAHDGNWFSGSNDNFEVLNSLIESGSTTGLISVDGTLYQNSGANMIQQVAYTLAHSNEYFNRFKKISLPIVLEVAVGSNYFFEIAKLRAMRLLFNLIAKEYGHVSGCHILAVPTKRNKTLYDYNVNMLRTTTECMSAIIGGADAISNMPYDALYHKSNEFAERISRNQLLILKHESYFDKVSNPADGSYYIESITSQIAEKAL
ncbi:MAG TPA: methylmalonyl-CoA mutase subunit beta, partial [Flavobacterium sp.]